MKQSTSDNNDNILSTYTSSLGELILLAILILRFSTTAGFAIHSAGLINLSEQLIQQWQKLAFWKPFWPTSLLGNFFLGRKLYLKRRRSQICTSLIFLLNLNFFILNLHSILF